MERGFQEYVAIWQVAIVLSCQLVLAMLHDAWRYGERNAVLLILTVEPAD